MWPLHLDEQRSLYGCNDWRLFQQAFISWKVDAEKEEKDLVSAVEINAYPTLVFFDQHGKMLYKHVGALDAEELLSLGKR